MIPIIDDLSRFVQHRWRAAGYDEAEFSRIAMAALDSIPWRQALTVEAILAWATTTRDWPVQVNLDASFGEPPITLFSDSKFYIEALFWLDGTTTIHQHKFSGAFGVLSGSSIHSKHEFRSHRRLNSYCQIGELRFSGSELLSVGSFREITAGGSFIHSLFHLERPSVSLVIRTHGDREAPPQYNYYRPGLARDPAFRDDSTTRFGQIAEMLAKIKHPDRLATIRTWLDRADAASAVNLLLRGVERGAILRDEASALTEIVEKRHSCLLGYLSSAIEHLYRENQLVSQRRAIHDPNLRFLLASLLNIPSRTAILEFISQKFPDQHPVDLITEWLTPQPTFESVPPNESTALFGLDEAEMLALRYLVKGCSNEQVLAHVKRDYEVDDTDLLLVCNTLRQTPLQTLFV